MPYLNSQNSGPAAALPLPVLRLLKAMGDGWQPAPDAGAAAEAARRGLVERRALDLDGKLEVAWRVTAAGRAALAADRAGRAELPASMGAQACGRERGEAGAGLRVGALVPVFGSNRTLADKVGEELAGCAWVGAPFAGGLAELPWIGARTVVAGDAHGHIVNLARVAADPDLSPELQARLGRTLFHDLELAAAQQLCWAKEAAGEATIDPDQPDLDWAAAYFACAWMSRNGTAGTRGEFQAPLSVRWDAEGGDSVKRFRGAVAGLPAWLELLAGRVTFVVQDAFDFLAKVKDREGCGLYCDPPFPGGLGKSYRHRFDDAAWRRLAGTLAAFRAARVVVRCHDVPLARELFLEAAGWRWRELVGRNQARERSPEVLIVKNG